MKALAVTALAAVLGCGGGQAAKPPAPPKAPQTPPKAQQAPPTRTLYQRGKPYAPIQPDDDRYTCWATDEDVAACRAVRPDARCDPESPVGYWEGKPRCKGAAPTPGEKKQRSERLAGLSVPHCECSCTTKFVRAADAFRALRERCSRLP